MTISISSQPLIHLMGTQVVATYIRGTASQGGMKRKIRSNKAASKGCALFHKNDVPFDTQAGGRSLTSLSDEMSELADHISAGVQAFLSCEEEAVCINTSCNTVESAPLQAIPTDAEVAEPVAVITATETFALFNDSESGSTLCWVLSHRYVLTMR